MDRDDETQGGPPDDTGSYPDLPGELEPRAIGQIGRFVVLRRLGSGGMGVVYLAYDNDLDRKLAIKVLRRRHADDHATALRMQREAQAMARIVHPNVLRVYEVGLADDRLFVAMEYVEGETLGAWLTRHGPPQGRAGLRVVLEIFARAGAGLAAAHDAGLVHRDFKPDNVLLDRYGGVRVADFGLARAATDAADSLSAARLDRAHPADSSRPDLDRFAARPDPRSALALDLTATRAVLGTPAYMAPEQHAGLALAAAADIFAFCVSLHEGLYGVRPFAGDSIEALADAAAREQFTAPPPGAVVPAWLRAIVLRGLRSDPDARWPSMHALLAALADDPVARRRRRRLALAGALALLTAVVLVVLALRGAARRLDEESARVADQTARVGEVSVERDQARERAEAAAREARDLLRMAVLRDIERDPTATLLVLAEVEDPDATPGWLPTAQAALHRPVSSAILRGESMILDAAFIGEAGEHVVVHDRDAHLRLFRRDGRGVPAELDLGIGLPGLVRIDPARVAAPMDGQRVGVWRLAPNNPVPFDPVAELTGAPARTRILLADPGGRRLVAIGTHDPHAVVWDLERHVRLGEFGCRGRPLRTGDLSRDGRHLLLATEDGASCLLDLAGGAKPRILRDWPEAHFTADPDLAFVLDPERAAVWPWRTGGRPRLIPGIPNTLRADIDPRARYLATLDFSERVRLHALQGPPATVELGQAVDGRSLAFSPDGRWLACAGAEQIALWRTDDLQGRVVFHIPGLASLPLVFSDDARWLLAGAGADVHVWSLADLEPTLRLETEGDIVGDLIPAPDGRTVAAVVDFEAAWWQVPGGLAPVRRHTLSYVFTTVIDDAAAVAAIAVGGGDIVVFDGAGRKRVLSGHTDAVWDLDFSADSRFLLSVGRDTVGRVWDLRSGRTVHTLLGHTGRIDGGALSPDATHAATFGRDGSLFLWDLRRGSPRGEQLLAPDRERADTVRFSPDGRWLLALTADAPARLWDLRDGGTARRLPGDGDVNDVCWDPRGRWFALAQTDGTVAIWDPRADVPIVVHRDHGAPVVRVACAPDGRSVAAATMDNTHSRVRIWPADRPGSAELYVVDDGDVTTIAFTVDGRSLLIGTGQGVVTRWTPRFEFDAAPRDVLTHLRTATTACLTARQRAWLLREPPDLAAARFTACERRFDRAAR